MTLYSLSAAPPAAQFIFELLRLLAASQTLAITEAEGLCGKDPPSTTRPYLR